MSTVSPGGRDWLKIWEARNPSHHGDGRRSSLSDPRFLLRVLTEEWRLFQDELSRVERGYATELRDAGNRLAHWDPPFSSDDTYRALDTMERLLAAVGAAEHAGHVRSLRLDFQQSGAGAATPSATSQEARADRRAIDRPERIGGFWSPVAHADVLRAIEEYDSLGQERFLAEHGFGRATAYLLIYRERSYDSKAILGVAYKFATGVPIGSHEFSGGVYGAAGVLGKLGFEVRNVRNSGDRRAEDSVSPGTPAEPSGAARPPARKLLPSSADSLDGIIPERSLLVLTCSGRKERGGRPPSPAEGLGWPQDLRDARVRVLATAGAETAHVLPAWRRYTGRFYQHARPALADAVTAGNVVIISGGYGLVRADEPIGWYDKMLDLGDWPAGLLESALISEARSCGAQTVVAFAAATTDYSKLLRRTPWVHAGIDARLVTIAGVTGGAMSEVPRQLALAFSAFWENRSDYPPGMTVELLR